jgi:ankyrin repeat protein
MAKAVDRKFIAKAQAKQKLLELIGQSDELSDKSPKQKDVEPNPEWPSETVRVFNSAINELEKYDEFEPASMQLLELAKSAHGHDWRDVQETLLSKAMGAAITPEQKYAVYLCLLDEIEDEKKAQAYLKANEGTLRPFLERKAAAEQEESVLDAICQCAMLVAVGDGEFTSAESDELERIRGIAGMMYRNRAAIALLEESKDIEKARASRSSTAVVHSLGIFTPSYIREISEALEDVNSRDDLDALCKAYAARIDDPFGRRLAAWAANEVAGSDVLDAGEKRALKLMTDIWGFNIQENQRYFASYVYPLISNEIDFDNPDNRSIADIARAADRELRDAMGDEIANKLTESLGVGSLEELVERLGLGEAEEEDEPEDTEDLPPMFAALLERNDWDDVLATIKDGADVNETITLNGLSGLSILTLAAELGTVDIVKALVEAGADVNRVIGDVKRASGYNTPLIASLKNGGRMDIFDYLLEAGANPDPFADKEAGWTPLTIAARNENHKAIKELLARGVNVNIATSAGANAFKTVSAQESANARKCMDILVKAGIDVARADNEGFAGIHNAAASGSVKLVQYHVEKAKVAVDLPLSQLAIIGASTPLLNAMSWGNIPVVDYLLENGADPSLKRSGFGIYAAIARATKDGDLNDPVEQLGRFLALGVQPALDEIAEITSILATDTGEDTDELAEFLEKLVMASPLSAADHGGEHATKLMEAISEAQDNFPDAVERMIEALANKGLRLGE